MKLTVHDVGLGQCISLISDTSFTMLWDAGTRDTFTPAQFLESVGINTINRFFITNFDQDHLTGLVEIKTKIKLLHRNTRVDADHIEKLKLSYGPLTEAMKAALEMHRTWTGKASPESLALPPGISFHTFSNPLSEDIQDTNNLSLVTVLTVNGMKFIISGDLERKGWDALIKSTDILDAISGSNVFVASHHGGENGYHETIMDVASPDCVVMSDFEVKHATQDSLSLYRRHCKGIVFNGENRHILTTRRDGSFTWTL